jgi:aspartate kinase
MKVVKFGGSSLASGEQLDKVFKIVMSDSERKVVVVSAPGKRFAEDIKVTDLLIALAEKALTFSNTDSELNAVLERYMNIAKDVDLSPNIIDTIREDLLNRLNTDKTNVERYIDLLKASGEDNNAKLVAAYFQNKGVEASYVDPKEAGLLVTNEPGNAQVLPDSYNRLYQLREKSGILIFPGFFGYNENGEVVTFSRSGSDITGSILANGIKADLYENFSDVDAVYSVNPNIIKNPNEIREITFREMRELAYGGFSVFHDEALYPAFLAGIPVNVKNTNNPTAPGTLIVKHRTNQYGPVIGISSEKGFCNIYVRKYLMNREIGFGSRLLKILEDYGLSYEHTPSGIDDLSVILRHSQMDQDLEQEIISRIQHELKADEVHVIPNIALIMVVGEGMRHNIGTMARASKALARSTINIEMINQGSSEVSMMFGVKEKDEKKAVQALYEEFFVGVMV